MRYGVSDNIIMSRKAMISKSRDSIHGPLQLLQGSLNFRLISLILVLSETPFCCEFTAESWPEHMQFLSK